MENNIRHRRLYAFFNSTLLNSMETTAIISLMLMGYCNDILMPSICASLSFVIFIGYSLWFWIKKPRTEMINTWLSNISSLYVLYFLIVVATKTESQIWYAIPAARGIITLFITLIWRKSILFFISEPDHQTTLSN